MPLPSLQYYDDLYNKRKANKPVAQIDGLDREIARMRSNEIKENLFLSAPPDTVARVNRVARETGELPLLVEDRINDYEKSLVNSKFMQVADDNPGIAKWAVNNPRAAAAAADDWESLSMVGKAWRAVESIGSSLKVGLYRAGAMAQDTLDAAQEVTDTVLYPLDAAIATIGNNYGLNLNPDRDMRNRRQSVQERRAENEAYVEANRPQVDGWFSRNLLAGVESVPATAAAVLTRNASAGSTLLGGLVGGAEYQTARDKGLNPFRAAVYGATQGSIETITERIPVSRLMSDIAAKSPVGKTLINQLVAEIPGEQAATFLQDLNEWATLNPDKTLAEFVAERPSAAAETLVQTIGGVGTTVALTKAAERTVDATVKVGERVAESRRAKKEGAFLDELAKATEGSKLKERDTEAFREMIRSLADENDIKTVYISGEALQEYMQSEGFDAEGPLSRWTAEVEEAAALGGDVVMPIEEAMAVLPGTPAWQALRDDMRLSPGGISRKEAQTFDEAMADVMDELARTMAEQEKATARKLEPIEKLSQSIAQKLQNVGFTPSAADTQARLLVQRYATRAERLGRELTGDEFGVTINQVLPEGIAQARAADNLDLVINSYFTMKKPKEQTGKSLVEWISSRGGITDEGGDLAAMGLGDWHKQKAFRKKVIRQSDKNQGNMLGAVSNDYSPNRILEAAIDEGYFPELQGTEEALDLNALLTAIEEELQGKPRYAQERIVDDVQQLAVQLDEFLSQSGFDPANMTREEMRTAIMQAQDAQEGGSRSAGDGSYNYVVFDDSRISIQAYEQTYGEGPRGRITFNSGQATIDLFQNRNLSTFLHEVGHLWLEELRFDAEMPDAPEQLKADWQKVQDWFASQGHKVENGFIPVEAHEMWARGVERYLMEGKAPNSALKRVFETFRAWLTAIYKVVDALKSPITPEIRGVMDRLIATDEQLQDYAEQQRIAALFKTAADAGMTGAEFAEYQRQTEEARTEANAKLIEKTMRSIRARETKRYKEAEATVREEITADVDARPLFKALRLLKTSPMDEKWIRSEMGEDSLSLLPRRVPPTYKSGGVHPDVIAEQSGFASGKAMVEALMGAEIAHRQAVEGGDKRSMRERTIAGEVDAIMQARYGDPLNDGTIEREALEAVHNEMQGEVIAAEIRVLARRTGRRPTPYAIARDWARNKIRQGVVSVEASPSAIQRYARAAAKAATKAQEAMLAQDVEEAFRQKQAQMVNNALVAEAKAAADEVEKAVKRMEKIAKRKTIKSVDQEYLEQAQALLENVDLRRRSQVGINRQNKFEAWAQEQQAAGHDVPVPPSFEQTLGKTNWTRLSVENLLSLDETIKHIMHLGRLKQTLLDNKERRDFDELVKEATDSAGNLRQRPPSDLMAPSYWDGIKSKILAADAALLKMETVFDWLDGNNPNGVFNRIVFRPIADAQEAERLKLQEYIEKLTDALGAVPKEVLARWGDKVTTGLLNRETGRPFIFTRDMLVSMALNVGNQSNLDKLAGGYGWNEGEILATLASNLTEAEWQYVQSVWDTIDSLWPEIEAMEKRINGVAPEKIEARPVETKFGTLRGGYFPVVYDPARNYDAEANAAKGRDLFETIYTRATTPKGFTKERTNVERPIHLSLGIINRHVAEVIHDLTHREAIMQADKFLSDKRVMKAVDDTLGPEVRRQFRPWLQRIANEWAYDRAGNAGAEKFLRTLRANATIVGMGFRLSTILMQAAGYSNSFERVGFKWVARRIKDVANPAAYEFVLSKSAEVAGRMDNLDRDIRDNVKSAMGKTDWLTAPKRFAFHGIAYMDRMVVIPTWLGAYDKAIAEGMADEDAVYAADKAVRQSQGSGAAKDLAAIQSGRGPAGEALKLMTMFYSYMSAFYQRQRSLGRDTRNGSVKDMPALLARAWWLIVVPPVLAELLAGRGPDEDEDEALWAFEKMMLALVGPIPLARDIAPIALARAKDDPTFGYKFTPVSGAGQSLINVVSDVSNVIEGEETKRATRNMIEAVGYFTGLTTGQMAAAAQFLVDVGYGEQDPQDFSDWWEGLNTGKIKEE